MGRLLPQALYRNEMVDEHHVRACLVGDNPEPCDVTDYAGVWERAAERIKVIDPHGRKSYALLRQMQLKAARTSGR